MSKKIEVEVRILLKNRSVIEKKLKALGAKIIYTAQLIDYWFCPKCAKHYKEASIDKTGFALRIRETKDAYSGRRTASLECKTLSDGKDHALCNEHEINLDDSKNARAILTNIGLKEFLVIDKVRVIYKYKDVKFCFDKIKGLGDGLEIEIMTSDNLAKAKEKVTNLALDLGIKRDEILEKSLTYLAMEKLGKF